MGQGKKLAKLGIAAGKVWIIRVLRRETRMFGMDRKCPGLR
jgi:hypothetical protein